MGRVIYSKYIRRVMQNSRVHQMMEATYPSSLWSIDKLMRPPFTSSPPPSSSSSTITNFLLAPPPNHIISHNHIDNHTFNHFFKAHHMNMSTPCSSWLYDNNNNNNNNHVQEQPPPFPESLSQLLLSGVYVEEEGKKMEMWEEQVSGLQHHHSLVDHMKQESSVNSYNNHNTNNHYNNNNNVYSIYNDQEFQLEAKSTNWSPHQINIPASSPQSCVSTAFNNNNNNNNNNNMVDFSSKCSSDNLHNTRSNPVPVSDKSFESNSTSSGGILKKQKVEPSSSQSTFKARKEKVGDRITTLHQLVSPFGKADTASVLLESFGYIRFLQSQIEALSVPYLTSGAANKSQQHTGMKVRKGVFPEDRGQLLHEKCSKRKGGPNQDSYEEAKDLRSRGLCLVPLSCTMLVGSDNGADYWAPALGGGSGFQ